MLDASGESLSVTDLVSKIKSGLEREFRFIDLNGEVTQITRSHSGHFYFNLSDKDSTVSAVLFRRDAQLNPLIRTLKEGDQVQVIGSLSVYQKRCSVQIITKKLIKFDAQGKLVKRFEELKSKLAGQGLFDLSLKKEIPRNTKKIGLITSPQGAAYGDFMKILDESSFHYHVVLIPALVQGERAQESLLGAFKFASDSKNEFDVIVLTRGGGSLEDLWCFNSEALARSIFDSKVPVISAVGHEINFSISDFVADLRCSTPSDAAKVLSTYQKEQLIRFQNISKRISLISKGILSDYHNRISLLKPLSVFKAISQKFEILKLRIEKFRAKDYFHILGLSDAQIELDTQIERTEVNVRNQIENYKKRLARIETLLSSLDPHRVLNRGYTFIKSNGKVLENAKNFNKNKEAIFSIVFNDGEVDVPRK